MLEGECTEIKLISTHTSLAGRDQMMEDNIVKELISTHTSLAGRDPIGFTLIAASAVISTHTSLAGRDAADP